MNANNHEEQPRQALVSITTKAPGEIEPEYRGPPIHFQIPTQIVQPTVHNPYQGVKSKMPLPHPRAPSAVIPLFTYPGAPYAPNGVQHDQTINIGAMYPTQLFPQVVSPPVLAHTTSQAA